MNTSNEASQENAKKRDSFGFSDEQAGTELIKRTPYKDTPFVLIHETTKNKHFAIIGLQRVTDIYGSEQQLKKELDKQNWGIIINILALVAKQVIMELNQTAQQNGNN